MQQRLQIARCLAQEPKALLMDEPFGALDAMTRQGLQDEVLSLVAASNATVIFVTHDLEEAIYLGDRVIGLLPHPGRIGIELSVDLPRPRDQLATREHPEFLRLRRELFDFIKASETVIARPRQAAAAAGCARCWLSRRGRARRTCKAIVWRRRAKSSWRWPVRSPTARSWPQPAIPFSRRLPAL